MQRGEVTMCLNRVSRQEEMNNRVAGEIFEIGRMIAEHYAWRGWLEIYYRVGGGLVMDNNVLGRSGDTNLKAGLSLADSSRVRDKLTACRKGRWNFSASVRYVL